MYSICKEYWNYDEVTGVFTWKKRGSQRTRVGDVVGGVGTGGYRRGAVRGVGGPLHRIAYWWVHGGTEETMPEIVDHINRDRLDNRIANLRAGDRTVNNRNLGLSKHNKTGFHGVGMHKGKFGANIFFNKKKWHLGTFSTLEQAVEARMYAEMVRDGVISKIRFQELYGKWIG